MHGPRALKSGYCKESYLMTKQNRSTIRNLVAQTFPSRVVAKIFPKFTLLPAPCCEEIKRYKRWPHTQSIKRNGRTVRTAECMKTGYKMQTVANAVKSLSSVFEYLADTETASMYDTSVERLCSKCYVMINFTCSCCHTYIRLSSRYNSFLFFFFAPASNY